MLETFWHAICRCTWKHLNSSILKENSNLFTLLQDSCLFFGSWFSCYDTQLHNHRWHHITHIFNAVLEDGNLSIWTCSTGLLPQNELSEHGSAGSPSGRRKLGRTCRGEVSLQCVSPCESAAPPSGWKPCHSVCTYRASHLKERMRSGQTEVLSRLERLRTIWYFNNNCNF